MNPTERRRIVWGDGEHANLDPFVVDVFGHVFNGDARRPLTPLDRKAAALSWRQHGDGKRLHQADPTASRLAGPRLTPPDPDALVRAWSDDLRVHPDPGIDVAARTHEPAVRWLFTLRATADADVWRRREDRPPVRLIHDPPEWLPLAGDPDAGWVCARLTKAVPFASVFHGPSVAAWLFGDTPST